MKKTEELGIEYDYKNQKVINDCMFCILFGKSILEGIIPSLDKLPYKEIFCYDYIENVDKLGEIIDPEKLYLVIYNDNRIELNYHYYSILYVDYLYYQFPGIKISNNVVEIGDDRALSNYLRFWSTLKGISLI